MERQTFGETYRLRWIDEELTDRQIQCYTDGETDRRKGTDEEI